MAAGSALPCSRRPSSAIGAWLDVRYGWITPAFDAIAHQFYEVPLLAAIRRPSQLVLVRWHLAIGSILLVLGLFAAPWLSRHGRVWLAIFGIGYAIRAVIWICGGNLPLVPGDSCHYLEVATSVLRGEGPVKHYVESFFRDYPRIRDGQGVLDDWATPLDAYVRASAFRIAGLGPDSPVAGAARRRQGVQLRPQPADPARALRLRPAALWMPRRDLDDGRAGHSAGPRDLRRIRAAGEPGRADVDSGGLDADRGLACRSRRASDLGLGRGGGRMRRPGRAVAHDRAGAAGGGRALRRRRSTAADRFGAALALGRHRRRSCACPGPGRLCEEYGTPFYSYTSYFEYNFSWTVHHYEKGNTLPSQFYTLENLPEIVRVKIKSLLLIVIYSTMIVGLPIVAGLLPAALGREARPGRETDLLVATIFVVFVLATLKSIADVTQVAQLGRYYLPVFALDVADGRRGTDRLAGSWQDFGRRIVPWLAATYCALVWADPTWAYDASWLVKRYQLHWPASARGRRVDPGPSRTSVAPGPDHDLVSLGAAGHERPDHDPHAPQLQPAADQGGDRASTE